MIGSQRYLPDLPELWILPRFDHWQSPRLVSGQDATDTCNLMLHLLPSLGCALVECYVVSDVT